MPDTNISVDAMKAACAAYVDGIARRDLEGIVALFADDVVIHDPVGKPPVTDRTTVREFFHNVVTHVYDAKLDGPVRGSEGDSAAFSFELYVEWPNGSKQIVRAVDVMTFNDAGKIVLMQAYHGPGDMVDA